MHSIPLALSPALPTQLISFVLTHQSPSIVLIICLRRADFLASLAQSIHDESVAASPLPVEPLFEGPPTHDQTSSNSTCHPLLLATLHQIATSRHITVVFIPTVSHFRAYAAVFPTSTSKGTAEDLKYDKPGRNVPLLVLYGLVDLHHDTSEWSAQGLGQSLSTLIEAGQRSGRKVVVVEQRRSEDISKAKRRSSDDVAEDGEGVDDQSEDERNNSLRCWEKEMPILNGSTRRAGIEGVDGGWSGRTVKVGRVLQRWFRFRRGEWNKDP